MTKEKTKPYQILLRNYEKKMMDDLIKHYEKQVPTRFTRADIMRIALNELHKKMVKRGDKK